MTDFAEHLIAARRSLQRAEDAANARHWQQMAHAAEQAALHAIQVEQWADAQLREVAPACSP